MIKVYNVIVDEFGIKGDVLLIDGELLFDKKGNIVGCIFNKMLFILVFIVLVLVGVGMLKVLLVILLMYYFIDLIGSIYKILVVVSNSVFYFFLFLLVFLCVKFFNVYLFVLVVIVGVLLEFIFIGLMKN